MSKYSSILIIVFITFFVVACDITKTVDFDFEDSSGKICIAGFIGLNNRAEIFVSTTQSPLSLEEDSIYEATVTLFENGVLNQTLVDQDEPVYLSHDLSPKLNNKYFVKVAIDGFETARSETVEIPPPVLLDSIRYFVNDAHEIILKVYFKDPPQKNFYALKIIRSINDTLFSKEDFRFPVFYPSSVFDDKNSNSETVILERKSGLFAGRFNNKAFYYNHLKIILFSINESGYDFFNGLDESDLTNGDMFTTPTIIKSNISNGYGIFTGYSTDTIKLNL